MRDLVNEVKTSTNPDYCLRVTAEGGEIGNAHLRAFQDNDKTIPAILTTSQKLSTGVDARNVRHIVFMRPVRSMIELSRPSAAAPAPMTARTTSPSKISYGHTRISRIPNGTANR
ncbi:MAG TPA: hypothetical protein VL147_05335 [Devosia sp.]|nr:hypothetical protein [Devosia sp.]